jgi:UDP-N-acetylmuramoyl-tripeptide--D-alanyl-D-alanine ligase
MKVIGLTGSVGKTTTKDMLARIAATRGPTVAAEGSFNNHLGVPLTVVKAGRDTAYVIVEMGANHEGEIAALARIAPPDVAVVLGVGKAHVGEFGSREAIVRAKSEIISGLMPNGTAVLNMDDPLVRAMAFSAPENLITFGFDDMARIRGSKRSLGAGGELRLTVSDQDTLSSARIETGLVGRHLAINVVAAVAAAVAAGIDLEAAAGALHGMTAVSPHRMALRQLPSGATLIDDSYNANPESLAAAIETLVKLAARSSRGSIAVLGEMRELGPESSVEHLRAGRAVCRQGIDRLIVVGEAARGIYLGAASHGMPAQAIEFWPDTDGLVSHLKSIAGQEFILIKGSHGTNLWKVAEELTGEDD